MKGNSWQNNGPMAIHYGVQKAQGGKRHLDLGTNNNVTIETSLFNQPILAPRLGSTVFVPKFTGNMNQVRMQMISKYKPKE